MTRARDFADLAGSADAGGLTGRNLIINGAMQVAQRGTSSTGLGATAGYYTCDRWKMDFGHTDGRLTMTQTADGPSGFANCIKLDCTTADTSVGANEYLILAHRFEGQDLQQFMKGTSDAKSYTVSFYVKGNASATYILELIDRDNSRSVSKTFSVTTAWARVEMTFPADTSGAFDDDNANSFDLQWWLHAGSTYNSGTLQQTWASTTAANRAVGGDSFFDSTDRTFFITGVQLEVGEVATPFEHRSFSDELARCQRYFFAEPQTRAYHATLNGFFSTTTLFIGLKQLPVPLRAGPSLSITGDFAAAGTTSKETSSETIANAIGDDLTSVEIRGTVSSATAGEGANFRNDNDTTATFHLDAEL